MVPLHDNFLICFLVHLNTTGATSFLFTEYQYVGIFMVGLSTKSQHCTYDVHRMCKPALATALFSTVSFLLEVITSVLSGFLGMKIATYANPRTTLEARKSVGKAFITAFRSGVVMGSLLFGSVHGWIEEFINRN
ncbi:putative inorganic diphosphatase [Helianthus anomalus]